MTAAGLITAAGARRLWAAQALTAGEPDTVVFNAKVYPVEPGASRAEAIAVRV
jgi:hypothetical protein